ncbi:MAG: metal-dependent hydrolase [Peptococcaceae bacterium]|nr:metal-dependent hydrolase [Peptococcaceae bacterium]
MDNLTHALVGVTVSRAFAGNAQRSPVWWAFLLGSEIPDIDVLYLLQGRTSYLVHHRGWTHSLPGTVVLSLAVALVVLLAARGRGSFREVSAASLLAAAVHVGLDALTAWGTGLLQPFRAGWVYLDVLPIIDPLVYLILFSALLAAWAGADRRRAAKTALAALLVFIAARGTLHFAAVHYFEGTGGAGRLVAMPTYNPLKWKLVIEQPGGFVSGRLNLGTGIFEETAHLATAGTSVIGHLAPTPETAMILNFFRLPVFSVVEREGGRFLLVKDLSYEGRVREVLLELNSPAETGVWYKAQK